MRAYCRSAREVTSFDRSQWRHAARSTIVTTIVDRVARIADEERAISKRSERKVNIRSAITSRRYKIPLRSATTSPSSGGQRDDKMAAGSVRHATKWRPYRGSRRRPGNECTRSMKPYNTRESSKRRVRSEQRLQISNFGEWSTRKRISETKKRKKEKNKNGAEKKLRKPSEIL